MVKEKKKPASKQQLAPVWDLIACSGEADVKAALEQGYEPFAITQRVAQQKTDISLAPGTKPAMALEVIVWCRYKRMVPVVDAPEVLEEK